MLPLSDQCSEDTVEFTDWKDDRISEVSGETADFERGATEPTELFTEQIDCEGALFGKLKRHWGIRTRYVPFLIACNDGKRLTAGSVNFEVNWPLKTRLIAGERLANAAVEFGIVSFPDTVAELDAGQIKIAVAKAKDCFRATRLHLVDAAALLGFIGMAAVKNHAIARFDDALRRDRDFTVFNAKHVAKEHTALFAKARMN